MAALEPQASSAFEVDLARRRYMPPVVNTTPALRTSNNCTTMADHKRQRTEPASTPDTLFMLSAREVLSSMAISNPHGFVEMLLDKKHPEAALVVCQNMKRFITRQGGPGSLEQDYLAHANVPHKTRLSHTDTVIITSTEVHPRADETGIVRLASLPVTFQRAIQHAFETLVPAGLSTAISSVDTASNHLTLYIESGEDFAQLLYPLIHEPRVAEEILGQLPWDMSQEVLEFILENYGTRQDIEVPEELVDGFATYTKQWSANFVKTACYLLAKPATGWLPPPLVTLVMRR